LPFIILFIISIIDIFICYNYFTSVNFYKPEQFFGDDYFYLVCKGFKILTTQLLISIYEMIDLSSYKKNNDYITNKS
jgi:hypothetical protein